MTVVTRVARVASPATLALALVLFLLPFLSVSCDTPGGYGRMNVGGTTSYSGLDLATGSAPSVDDDHLRPAAEQQSDDLGVQPLVALAAIAIAGSLVFSRIKTRYRLLPAVIAGVGAVLVVIGSLLARASLVDRVAEQTRAPFPDGKSAGAYVTVGIGFWLVWILAVLGTGLAALGARPVRERLPEHVPTE